MTEHRRACLPRSAPVSEHVGAPASKPTPKRAPTTRWTKPPSKLSATQRAVLVALEREWEADPTLRLGQLVHRAAVYAGHDVYGCDDGTLLRGLELLESCPAHRPRAPR